MKSKNAHCNRLVRNSTRLSRILYIQTEQQWLTLAGWRKYCFNCSYFTLMLNTVTGNLPSAAMKEEKWHLLYRLRNNSFVSFSLFFFFFLLLFSLPHQPPENKCSLLRGRCVLQAPLSSAACSFTYLPYFASSVSHCFRAADLGGYSCRLDPNPFTLSLTDPCAAQYIKKGKKNPLWDHPCV